MVLGTRKEQCALHFYIGENCMKASEKSNLKIVSPTPTPLTYVLPTEEKGYGVGQWDLTRSKPIFPMDNWLLQQAQSYLGRTDVTVEEAKELWKRVDIVSRREIVT